MTEGTATTPLTRRQMEIAALLAEGLTEREVAERLGIAKPTVRNMMDRARRRVGARNTTHLITILYRQAMAAEDLQ